MDEKGQEKYVQIDKRLSIVKSACLLFAGVIFFKTLFYQIEDGGYSKIYAGTMPIVLIMMYYLWNILMRKNNAKGDKKSKYTENIIIGIVVLGIVVITGNYASPYKFLFLIIIITSTIQLGKRDGMIMTLVISGALLGSDLIFGTIEFAEGVVNSYFENDLILIGIFLLTSWILGVYVTEEEKYITELQRMVHYDGLTDVYNHRYFYEALKTIFLQAKEQNGCVSLLFIDIDYFKQYNDLNGYQEGDKVLRKLGELLKVCVDEEGIIARYGGEEFAVLLPNYTQEEACVVAEKIRSAVEAVYFEGQENQPEGNLTLSIGVSNYPLKAKDAIELVKSADDALYRAKFFNKNKVETYSSIIDELEKNIDKKEIDVINSLKSLIGRINKKDRYTYGHIERVVLYSKFFADAIGLSEADTRTLVCGAYIHDIGKINIDKDILVKKMPLAQEEWECLKQHPEKGVEVIESIECLQSTKSIIRHHHERYDGSGYPDRLQGNAIPYLARVLTVIDSFDAMTSSRSYNKRKSYEEGMLELRRCKGTQFDPEITEQFIQVVCSKYKNIL